EVSWVLPSQTQSEHAVGSSPARGAEFTRQVLDTLTANPETWSKTVFLLLFDENDGQFDHLPPPAVPSYNIDGTLAGKSTLDLAGMYFVNDKDEFRDELTSDLMTMYTGKPNDTLIRYIDKRDTISGNVRPWGLGARVPLYVISPWSKGGWVNSQVFDHTSVGQFLEKRFGVTIPAISPWHRAVSGDLTSAFDFATPNRARFPKLPDTRNYLEVEKQQSALPAALPPSTPKPLYQESGSRYSRALPYELHVHGRVDEKKVSLEFRNSGTQGIVFHVYDKLHLDRIPRRYTVEAGKSLADEWNTAADSDNYDLQVYAANGFFRSFKGNTSDSRANPEVVVSYDAQRGEVQLQIKNTGIDSFEITINPNAYRNDGPWALKIKPGKTANKSWALKASGNWYDFTVQCPGSSGFERRFAGRVESGKPGISDPAMATQ
ncbi:MAG TPA: phospholipase domain-containing protein, partial [Spongiibacteraceae bacterium]|nr:phospholipase domain-containing protein [Spongiibacteraceae bacterium]